MKASLFAALLMAAPSLALAQDLTGGWTISSTVQNTPATLHCTLMQTGAKLAGFCAPADGTSRRLVRGKADDKHASWAFEISRGGRTERLALKADITGAAAMKGVLTGSGRSEPFTAVKDWAHDNGLG
jgi:hypothetical protein